MAYWSCIRLASSAAAAANAAAGANARWAVMCSVCANRVRPSRRANRCSMSRTSCRTAPWSICVEQRCCGDRPPDWRVRHRNAIWRNWWTRSMRVGRNVRSAWIRWWFRDVWRSASIWTSRMCIWSVAMCRVSCFSGRAVFLRKAFLKITPENLLQAIMTGARMSRPARGAVRCAWKRDRWWRCAWALSPPSTWTRDRRRMPSIHAVIWPPKRRSSMCNVIVTTNIIGKSPFPILCVYCFFLLFLQILGECGHSARNKRLSGGLSVLRHSADRLSGLHEVDISG